MNVSLSQVRIALAILGALALALLLNQYIVTDKRRVERTVRDMGDAAAKADIDGLFSHISADYRDDAMTREQLRNLAKSLLYRYEPMNPQIQWVTVNVAGALAHVQVSITSGGERGGYTTWSASSEWSVEFRKEAGGAWRATSIRPVRVYGRDVSGWHDVLTRFN